MRAPDAAFADKRLAVLYDDVEGDRTDLDAYVAIADELAVASFVDIGCGTGSLAIRLARRGRTVVGVDPALACLKSLERNGTRTASSGCTVMPPR